MASYLVQDYLDNTQEVLPSGQAVICGNSSISYDQLYISSNRLANCLVKIGVTRQDRVVFCLKRSTDCIVAIFGILKADAIYVPIDPKSPSQRLNLILDDCKPSAVICDRTTIDTILVALKNFSYHIPLITTAYRQDLPSSLSEIFLPHIICRNQLDKYDPPKPVYNNIDTDTAYILYTSGSTGKPKGVMISHLNITNYIDWAVDCFDITDKDRLFHQTVLLVDCDFKKQDIHKKMGLPGKKGLTDYFLDNTPLNDLIVWPGIQKMTLISGGKTVSDTAELLGSPKMKSLVQEMKQRYSDRYIFFDVAPLLDSADAIAFAPFMDGIVMVVESGKTTSFDIKKGLKLIPEEKFFGFVLNRS